MSGLTQNISPEDSIFTLNTNGNIIPKNYDSEFIKPFETMIESLDTRVQSRIESLDTRVKNLERNMNTNIMRPHCVGGRQIYCGDMPVRGLPCILDTLESAVCVRKYDGGRTDWVLLQGRW